MNIFRELVEELKDENLLEETVTDPEQGNSVTVESSEAPAEAGDTEIQPLKLQSSESENEGVAETDGPFAETNDVKDPAADEEDSEPKAAEADHATHSEGSESAAVGPADVSEEKRIVSDAPVEPIPIAEWENVPKPAESETAQEVKAKKIRSVEEEKKFYRQRAMDEVIGLQLVEHVLSGVEREQMKSTPKSFDDLAVKRALHDFLKVADDLNSPDHAKAEFQLMQETENWCSALSRRDRNISVAHLRRYCETTKPSLSSQALISLARFYRNSPYSESVRSKFDLVFTKLFSKDQGGELRTVVFKNGELIKHVQELYADWSSIPLYSTDDDDAELLLTALKFQEFINEANIAESFDELVRKDFFKRLKVFKEKTNENFFAPLVVAAAIESNVAVGNRYVELIELERVRSAGTDIIDKYGPSHDISISDATSKTLELLEILQSKKPEILKKQPQPVEPSPVEPVAAPVKSVAVEADPPSRFLSLGGGANKWLIVATVVVFAVTAWLFLQGTTDINTGTQRAKGSAKEFAVSGTSLNEYVQSAKISRNTMYGITGDSFDKLSEEQKLEIVQKALELGKGNEFERVHLLNSAGKSVAFGSKSKVTVY